MNDKDITKRIKFQRGVYQVVLFLCGWFFSLFTRFSYKRYRPKSKTFLLVGNHNMNLDPFQAVIATGRHIRFVSNDAILKSFWGPVISFFVGPIPRKRGAATDEVVELILKNLKAGISVAMYPESERSWDGTTQVISRKTAELAKESGAGLVTMASAGGYLRTPHWAQYNRRGRTFGRIVNEYSPQQLEQMSVDEVYEAICADLYVNAFEYNRKAGYKYKGRKLAESLELVCCVCPKCSSLGQMSTADDIIKCGRCGYTLRYNEYGFLEGPEVIFDNVADWSSWQKGWFAKHAAALKEQTKTPIIVNNAITLFKAGKDDKMEEIISGAKALFYGDRIDIDADGCTAESFPLKDISKMGAFGKRMIMLTCSGKYYKISSAENRLSGYIYYGLWRVLTGREYR